MKKFVRNWLEVIVAVTFLVGIGAFWAASDSRSTVEVAVTATDFTPAAVDTDRSIASDGTEAEDETEATDESGSTN